MFELETIDWCRAGPRPDVLGVYQGTKCFRRRKRVGPPRNDRGPGPPKVRNIRMICANVRRQAGKESRGSSVYPYFIVDEMEHTSERRR